MLCPICRKEYYNEVICSRCGFDELHNEFINKDEYELWYIETVIKYKKKFFNKLFEPYSFSIENYEKNKTIELSETFELLETSVLSVREFHTLYRSNIHTIEDIVEYFMKKECCACLSKFERKSMEFLIHFNILIGGEKN